MVRPGTCAHDSQARVSPSRSSPWTSSPTTLKSVSGRSVQFTSPASCARGGSEAVDHEPVPQRGDLRGGRPPSGGGAQKPNSGRWRAREAPPTAGRVSVRSPGGQGSRRRACRGVASLRGTGGRRRLAPVRRTDAARPWRSGRSSSDDARRRCLWWGSRGCPLSGASSAGWLHRRRWLAQRGYWTVSEMTTGRRASTAAARLLRPPPGRRRQSVSLYVVLQAHARRQPDPAAADPAASGRGRPRGAGTPDRLVEGDGVGPRGGGHRARARPGAPPRGGESARAPSVGAAPARPSRRHGRGRGPRPQPRARGPRRPRGHRGRRASHRARRRRRATRRSRPRWTSSARACALQVWIRGGCSASPWAWRDRSTGGRGRVGPSRWSAAGRTCVPSRR